MKSQKNTNRPLEGRKLERTPVIAEDATKHRTSKKDPIDILLNGRIATIPTETVEGYAVALNSESGIRELMRLKDRDFGSGKVFTLVPESVDAISKYVIVSEPAMKLITKYFPGELTLILPKNPDFHHFYYDHYDTIGIRIPDHQLFPDLLRAVGPILLTSANPRGGTPKSTTGHRPSTIVDLTNPHSPKIVRHGELKI